jgi:short-subunit dehydrogenase
MGIGLELARVFAANGHALVLVARSEDRLHALRAELEGKHGIAATVMPADLADPEAPARVEAEIAAKGLVVDYLVNNAGFGATGAFHTADLARQLEMIRVNILALTDLTHRFVRGMVARQRGGVLNIASTAGFQPGPKMAVYYATKAYVIAFSEALAEEVGSHGVRVTACCPGPVATEFARTAGVEHSLLFRFGVVAKPDAVASGAYRALMRGRVVAIHGVMNWVGVQLLRVAPRMAVRRLTGWVNSTR